ncbi:MAG: hypothetical protein ABI615_03860 [Chthoniobacterales bacterium]
MSEELPIQKLLRLKRYEQPPQGYNERFLAEFQRRQRATLMKRSPWENFVSGISEHFSQFHVGPLAYAATIAVAAVFSFQFLSQSPDSAPVAANNAPAASAPVASYIPQASSPSRVTIPANAVSMPVSGKFSPTQYVLESHPVSHEHPFAF